MNGHGQWLSRDHFQEETGWGVAQWQSACLAYVRLNALCPVPQNHAGLMIA